MTRTREAWVDNARAIGIVLVVYGHVARGVYNAGIPLDKPLHEWVDSVIYSFHMPLFFFLSGLFFAPSLRRDGRLGVVASRVDTILYPYIVWSLLHGLIEVGLSRYTNSKVSLAEVATLLWWPRAHFWFLYALFLICAVSALLYWRTGLRHRTLVLAAALVLALVEGVHPLVGVPWHYVPANLVFFAFGVCFIEWAPELERRAGAWLVPLLLLFVAGQWLVHGPLGLRYSDGGPWLLALAMLSIVFVATLCMVLARWQIGLLQVLGASTMSIFLMHVLAGSGARIVLQKFLHVGDPMVHLLIGCIAGLALPIVIQPLLYRMGLGLLFEPPRTLSLSHRWRPRARPA